MSRPATASLPLVSNSSAACLSSVGLDSRCPFGSRAGRRRAAWSGMPHPVAVLPGAHVPGRIQRQPA
jgi:hypothetical protein